MPGLKGWLHRDLPARDKLLLVLASFDQPAKLPDLRGRSEEAGFKLPKKWNLSDVLGRSGGLAIRVPAGWELADTGRAHLRGLGVESNTAAVQVATDLRNGCGHPNSLSVGGNMVASHLETLLLNVFERFSA